MKRFLAIAAVALVGVLPAVSQSLDDLNIQLHGYATQGFLYTTHNNAFYAESSNGSPAWIEAVLNVSAVPTPKLRVAVQARYALLGTSGNALTLDWAAADYKVNDRFGVRFGKVKTPWGLFNETQDIDSSYMWSLLPRASTTSQLVTPIFLTSAASPTELSGSIRKSANSNTGDGVEKRSFRPMTVNSPTWPRPATLL